MENWESSARSLSPHATKTNVEYQQIHWYCCTPEGLHTVARLRVDRAYDSRRHAGRRVCRSLECSKQSVVTSTNRCKCMLVARETLVQYCGHAAIFAPIVCKRAASWTRQIAPETPWRYFFGASDRRMVAGRRRYSRTTTIAVGPNATPAPVHKLLFAR